MSITPKRLMLYCSTHFLVGLSSATLGPTLPALANQTATTISAISFLFALRAFAKFLGSIAAGIVFDRFNGHHLLILSLLVIALTMFFTGHTSLVIGVSGAFLLMGFAEALLDTGGNTMLLWSNQGELGASITILHFAFSFGGFVAPLIIAQLIGWQGSAILTYQVLPLLMFLPLPFLLMMPTPTLAEPSNTRDDMTHSENHHGFLIVAMLLLIGLYVGIEASFGGWIYTYATVSGIASDINAAYLNSVYWALISFGRLAFIPINHRYTPTRVLPVVFIGMLVSMIIIAWADDLWWLVIGTAGLGFMMAPVFPTIFTMAGNNLRMTGQVTSWFFISSTIAAITLPWLIGQLFGVFGVQAITWSMITLTGSILLMYQLTRSQLAD